MRNTGSVWSLAKLCGALTSLLWAGTFTLGLEAREQQPDDFLSQAKAKLRGNFLLDPDDRRLQDYRWKCTVERRRLDRHGKVKDHETVQSWETFESEGRLRLRVTVFQDGAPAQVTERPITSALAVRNPDFPELSRLRDSVWEVTNMAFQGRQVWEGRPARVYSFRTLGREPEDDLEAGLAAGRKAILKSEGRLWFDEQDKSLVAVEGEYYGKVVLARGGFASGAEIKKGARWSWRMRKVNDRDWLPIRKKRTDPYFSLVPYRRGHIQTVHLYNGFEPAVGEPLKKDQELKPMSGSHSQDEELRNGSTGPRHAANHQRHRAGQVLAVPGGGVSDRGRLRSGAR